MQRDGGLTLVSGDSREVAAKLELEVGLLVLDPPYDKPELMEWSEAEWARLDKPPALVFTDPGRLGFVTELFGGPDWVFTWDTMAPWQTGPKKPLTQTKFCLFYGPEYNRDATLWGAPPPARAHPGTVHEPLAGRRLVDLWRESLRWLHHPGAGVEAGSSNGSDRFRRRQGEGPMRHAKPVEWVRCLIGNTSTGLVFDPFLGSGTTAIACQRLSRPFIGVDIDPDCVEFTRRRLEEDGKPASAGGQLTLDY